MTSGRGTLTVLHLLLVWATMAAAVPTLGVGLVMVGWGGGMGAAATALVFGVPLTVLLLATAGLPARTVVPMCDSARGRLGWAVLVFVLGTLGVLAGVAAYGAEVDLGSAGTRIALTGVPYAVAAAFLVTDRWVRLGATAVLVLGVVYGGFVGPAQAEQREHAAEVARYREHRELLYLGDAPTGMRLSRAVVEPSSFRVEYLPADTDFTGYVGLTVRSPHMPSATCAQRVTDGVTCSVDARGEMRVIREFPGGGRDISLVRRHRGAEVEVSSQFLDEPGLRRLLDTLHPLSDEELEGMLREKTISEG
ncbi:hypothetical protein P9869_13860 [Streptomyces ossamyceticus]|nr:hypothetical protein [Streptomyces ossamyceticus]